MIDVIIPVYNARKTLFNTLCSVALQSIKDKIIVHIVDDCSSCEYDDILKKFSDNLNIKFYKLEKNGGPGVARQYMLENTFGDYVCFIDSDDLFNNYKSLENLYNAISCGNDYVVGMVLNERDNMYYYTESDLHGKLYRRSFIFDKGIFFPDTRVHEDNVFNNLVRLNSPKMAVVKELVYVYCNNSESITSVDDEIEFERLGILISNTDLVLKTALNHKCNELLIKQFIFEKTKYFSKRYKYLSSDKQNVFKKMIDCSLIDSNYLFENDYEKMKSDIFSEDISKYC